MRSRTARSSSTGIPQHGHSPGIGILKARDVRTVARTAFGLCCVLTLLYLFGIFSPPPSSPRQPKALIGVHNPIGVTHGVCDRKASPRVCVLVRYTPKQLRKLPGFLSSLHGSFHDGPLHITIVATDKDLRVALQAQKEASEVFRQVSDIFQDPCITGGVSKRTQWDPMVERLRRSLKLTRDVNDYGYLLTDVVTDDLLARQGKLECAYFLFTNGDNLYHTDVFPTVTPHMLNGTELIAVHMVTHHKWHSAAEANEFFGANVVDSDGPNTLIRTRIRESQVDLGAVFVSASALRRKRIRFSDGGSFFTADGRFMSRLVDMGLTNTVIPQILFFHQ